MNCRSEELVARYIAAGCTRYEAAVLEIMVRTLCNVQKRGDYAEQVSVMLESGKSYIECANWIKAQQEVR